MPDAAKDVNAAKDAACVIGPVGDGFGVFAARDIAAGETIGRFEGTETTTRT